MTTQIGKDPQSGWKAVTEVPIKIQEGVSHILMISTYKRSYGKVVTSVSVGRLNDGLISHACGADYSSILRSVEARSTERTISKLHQEALDRIDTIERDIMEHYK